MNIQRSATIEKARWFGYDVVIADRSGMAVHMVWRPTIRQARAFVRGHFSSEG